MIKLAVFSKPNAAIPQGALLIINQKIGRFPLKYKFRCWWTYLRGGQWYWPTGKCCEGHADNWYRATILRIGESRTIAPFGSMVVVCGCALRFIETPHVEVANPEELVRIWKLIEPRPLDAEAERILRKNYWDLLDEVDDSADTDGVDNSKKLH